MAYARYFASSASTLKSRVLFLASSAQTDIKNLEGSTETLANYHITIGHHGTFPYSRTTTDNDRVGEDFAEFQG